jgi:hypothetical protein
MVGRANAASTWMSSPDVIVIPLGSAPLQSHSVRFAAGGLMLDGDNFTVSGDHHLSRSARTVAAANNMPKGGIATLTA